MGDGGSPKFYIASNKSTTSFGSATGLSSPRPSQTERLLRSESGYSASADNVALRRPATTNRITDLKMSGSRATLSGREVILREEGTFSSTTSLNWSGHQTHHRIVHSASCASSLGIRNRDLSADELNALNEERLVANQKPYIISPTGRVTVPLAITAVIAVFGGSFPHGWNTGVLNAPQDLIKQFLNESYTSHYGGGTVSDNLLNILWSLTVSIYLVGGCAGALSAGWLANRFGRKRALLVLHVFGFIGGALFALCKFAGSLEMLILGRLLVGFGCGAASGLVPMYLTEIAPVNIRGAMGVLHQCGLTIGIFVSQIFGIRQILGNELWPYLLLLTALPCLVCLIVLPFMPESPRFLLINNEDEDGATAALRRFRGTNDVDLDINEMKLEHKQQKDEPEWTFRQLFASKMLRLPLFLVCALACCQQLSGINVVFYYSSGVFEGAGVAPDYIQYAVIGTGFINVLMTLISVPLVERSGRRPLLLVGMVIMVISMALLTVALNLKEIPAMAYVSIIWFFTYVIGFAIGLGSIPQFIGGELFKQGPKPPAMSIGGLLNWLCNFLVGISFPSMEAAIKEYSFIPYIVIVIVFIIIIWKYLPETKNKTYEEIYQMFAIPLQDNSADQMEVKPIYAGNGRNSTADVLQQQESSFAPRGDANGEEATAKLLSSPINGNCV